MRSRGVVVAALHSRGRSRASRASASPLGGGERLGAARLELGELAAFALELRERLLQPRLERARDEPVLGLARVELALRAAGFELGALDREPLAGQPLVVLALELPDRLRAGADPGRGDRLQERGGDRLLQPQTPPSDWQAASVPCRWCARTHA